MPCSGPWRNRGARTVPGDLPLRRQGTCCALAKVPVLGNLRKFSGGPLLSNCAEYCPDRKNSTPVEGRKAEALEKG